MNTPAVAVSNPAIMFAPSASPRTATASAAVTSGTRWVMLLNSTLVSRRSAWYTSANPAADEPITSHAITATARPDRSGTPSTDSSTPVRTTPPIANGTPTIVNVPRPAMPSPRPITWQTTINAYPPSSVAIATSSPGTGV